MRSQFCAQKRFNHRPMGGWHRIERAGGRGKEKGQNRRLILALRHTSGGSIDYFNAFRVFYEEIMHWRPAPVAGGL